MSTSSNLRVFVSFKEDTVFAGEDIEATITFKNVEPLKRPQEKPRQRGSIAVPPIHESPTSTQLPPSLPGSRAAHSRHPSIASQSSKPPARTAQARRQPQLGHRQALSLNILDATSPKDRVKAPQSAVTAPGTPKRGPHSHGRSVSIISIGNGTDQKGKRTTAQQETNRPGLKLARSASVQVTPTTGASSRWGYSASHGVYKTAPSPLAASNATPQEFPWDKSTSERPSVHVRHASMGNGAAHPPRLTQAQTTSGRIPQASKMPPSSFKFPPSPSPSPDPPAQMNNDDAPRLESVPFSPVSTTTITPTTSDIPPRISSRTSAVPPSVPRLKSPDRRPAINRVFSLSSEAGTPRSSTDIYSSSNHSDETMASEIPSMGRLLKRPPFFRGNTSQLQPPRQNGPETLMMGFANITGTFHVDGSLVSQTPFEDVKRKAVVGGHGAGGVVGVDQRKGGGGFFGGFSWGGIGESLGSMLGGDQQSTIRDMKNEAESSSVPLLSTPQSVLFVDLRLAPGESRSYSYSFTLPRGLPPTHKGRAMKVSYQLVIGTQRPGSGRSREQKMHEVEIPFRVFGGVDARGEILGHDLMSPYVILRDQARSSLVELNANGKPAKSLASLSTKTTPNSSEAEFNAYVGKLLSSPRRNSSTGLISPSAPISPNSPQSTHTRRPSGYPMPPPPATRVLVDSAIRMSTHQRSGDQAHTSQTHFTIARAGQSVATLILSRSALRLGDLLNLTLDFTTTPSNSDAGGPTLTKTLVHAITLTLESAEHIDPSLSVRSAASVERVTRRVWDRRVVGGAQGAALGWCKRWSGGLKIPNNATPSFSTSGVECKWVARVEIAVGLSSHRRKESLATPGINGEQEVDESDEEDDHQGEGAARRRAELEKQETALESSDASTPSHSPAPNRMNSLRRKPTIPKQHALNRQKSQKRKEAQAIANEEQAFARSRQLLERVIDDERGVTLAAVRRVPGDVFEIAVPIRVFGGIGVLGGESGLAEEGLPV